MPISLRLPSTCQRWLEIPPCPVGDPRPTVPGIRRKPKLVGPAIAHDTELDSCFTTQIAVKILDPHLRETAVVFERKGTRENQQAVSHRSAAFRDATHHIVVLRGPLRLGHITIELQMQL